MFRNQFLNLNNNPEVSRLHHRPDMLIFTAHFHKTVVRHGFEGSRQVSRLTASHVRQGRDGMRLCITDNLEQRPILVTEHFGQGTHGREPDARLGSFGLVLAFSNSKHPLTNPLLG